MISTDNGNLRIVSQGNIAFQAGAGGQIQFMTADGQNVIVGQPGQKVENYNISFIGKNFSGISIISY